MKAGLLYRICDAEELLQGPTLFYSAIFKRMKDDACFISPSIGRSK